MEIPDFLQGQAEQVLTTEQATAEKKGMWAVIYGLVPFKDGDRWCVLLGENIESGVAGFGKTPYEAMWEFDQAMCKP